MLLQTPPGVPPAVFCFTGARQRNQETATAQRQLVAGQTYTDTRKAAGRAGGTQEAHQRNRPSGRRRVTVANRRHLEDQGILDVLLEAAEQARKRLKEGQRKAG